MTHRIAATIVLYRPERDALRGLVRSLAADVAHVFLYLNSALPPGWLEECAALACPAALATLGTGANLGLGRAYNEAAEAAHEAGCDLLLLFDQDSEPPPGMARRLAEAFDTAVGLCVAVVGPLPVAPSGTYKLPPVAAPAAGLPVGLRDSAFLISSGSLIDLAALAEIGPFREDFFIDGIDIEWCFRARARGYRCLMARTEKMPHRLGHGVTAVKMLNLHLIDNTPQRLFTHARNQIAMMRLAHVPAWWKFRAGAGIALRMLIGLGCGAPRAERAAIWRGIVAGLRHELGPPAQPV
ncbi:MAG: hypothetical protein ACREFB_12855 [Stellaceae bacterium]